MALGEPMIHFEREDNDENNRIAAESYTNKMNEFNEELTREIVFKILDFLG